MSLSDLPWVPKDRFEQLLIKGGVAKESPEARLKRLEKLFRTGRSTAWEETETRECKTSLHPNLVRDPAFDPLLEKARLKFSGSGTHSFWGRNLVCLPLSGKALKLSFATSPKTVCKIWFVTSVQRGLLSKEPACQCRRWKRWGFDSWVRKIPWRKTWQPTPVFLPREPQGQRSLVGYSP